MCEVVITSSFADLCLVQEKVCAAKVDKKAHKGKGVAVEVPLAINTRELASKCKLKKESHQVRIA